MKKFCFTQLIIFIITISFAPDLVGQCFYLSEGMCRDRSKVEGPLIKGALSLGLKGGIQPTYYSGRSPTYLMIRSLARPLSIGFAPKFTSQFHLPWQAGLEVAWNVTCHTQLFFEYFHEQSDGDETNINFLGINFNWGYGKYLVNAIYLGTRYYMDNIVKDEVWGHVSPFVGFKGGMLWQDLIRHHFKINGIEISHPIYYYDQLAMSTGIQLGLEWFINCAASIALTGEMVATQNLRNNRHIDVSGLQLFFTHANLGETGKLLSFPVTLTLRCSF